MPCCAQLIRSQEAAHHVSFQTRTSSMTLTRGVSLKHDGGGNLMADPNTQQYSLIDENGETAL